MVISRLFLCLFFILWLSFIWQFIPLKPNSQWASQSHIPPICTTSDSEDQRTLSASSQTLESRPDGPCLSWWRDSQTLWGSRIPWSCSGRMHRECRTRVGCRGIALSWPFLPKGLPRCCQSLIPGEIFFGNAWFRKKVILYTCILNNFAPKLIDHKLISICFLLEPLTRIWSRSKYSSQVLRCFS